MWIMQLEIENRHRQNAICCGQCMVVGIFAEVPGRSGLGPGKVCQGVRDRCQFVIESVSACAARANDHEWSCWPSGLQILTPRDDT